MLENDQIVLRAVEPTDIDYLYQLENNADLWHFGNTIEPYSRFVIKNFIIRAQKDIYTTKQLRLIIGCKSTNQPIGAIDLFDFDPYHNRAGVGIVIDKKENRHQGFAEQALRLIIDYSFNFLHLHQLYCTIAADNLPSIKLFTKCGFVQCSTYKEWRFNGDKYIDELGFQLIANKND